MKTKQHRIEALTHGGLVLALFLSLNGFAWAAEQEGSGKIQVEAKQAAADDNAVPAATLTDLKVFFKLDPRLTRGLYMGERWVSPPTYVGAGAQDTVEARVQGIGPKGRVRNISAQWAPADPEMVAVSPSQGKEVKITVKRAGESRLRVTSHGVTKELAIKAAYQGDSMQVEIAQLGVEQPAEAAPTQDAPALKSHKETLSYALGVDLGRSVQKQSLDVDNGLVIQGLTDALSGSKTLLTEEQVRATLADLRNMLKQKQLALQAEKKKELAEKNKKEGEAFLAENKAREGVVTLASGLQYKILKAGDGQKPTADDTVVCHYRGTLIDGTEFDSSYKRNRPTTFVVKRLIKGWSEALQLMPAGSKWQLFIPANLAYGAGSAGSARGGIGPNATLIFEVELVAIPGKS